MRIDLIVADQRATATLDDSPAGRDFATMLPLLLNMSDFHRTEKIADLPRAVTTEGAPAGFTPKAGDIAFYAPWGNLAIFYRDFQHSDGLIRLGQIDAGRRLLEGPDGTFELIIEVAE